MRGALNLIMPRSITGRIIPAYAGSTVPRQFLARRMRDHPRVCGEHHDYCSMADFNTGSSPRMRGALRHRHFELAARGIIPAYAGSTSRPIRRLRIRRDHPRVCGEHSGCGDTVQLERGSSPRMRGAQPNRCIRFGANGIIPAYAGSTCPQFLGYGWKRDHPRVCGEHSPRCLAAC